MMNLKNRIKKIEEQVPKDSNECKCFDKHHLALLNQAYGDSYTASDILPDDAPYEGVCIKCKKQMSPTVKEFYDTLVQCYGDFDFDEFKAQIEKETGLTNFK